MVGNKKKPLIFYAISLAIFLILIPLTLIILLEIFFRSVEEEVYRPLSAIDWRDRHVDLRPDNWKPLSVTKCNLTSRPPFHDDIAPLVLADHLDSKDSVSFSNVINDLGLFAGLYGPAVNSSHNIYVMGGSTIAGDGLECEEYTLPAALNRANEDRQLSFQNWGHSAYTSSESANYLIQMLKRDQIPDEVWFIEGVNDSIQRVIKAAPSYKYPFLAIGFSGSKMGGRFSLRYALVESFSSRSALFRYLTKKWPVLTAMIVEGPNHLPAAVVDYKTISSERLLAYRANIAAEQTLREYKFIKYLGELIGFKTRFFLQPSIFDRMTPTSIEERIIRDALIDFEKMDSAFTLYAEALLDNAERYAVRVFDVRSCVSEIERPIYFDAIHLSPIGNEILARCLTGIERSSWLEE